MSAFASVLTNAEFTRLLMLGLAALGLPVPEDKEDPKHREGGETPVSWRVGDPRRPTPGGEERPLLRRCRKTPERCGLQHVSTDLAQRLGRIPLRLTRQRVPILMRLTAKRLRRRKRLSAISRRESESGAQAGPDQWLCPRQCD